MTSDLRTPLQKVTEEALKLINIVYKYADSPNDMINSGESGNIGYFNWNMLMRGVPEKYAYRTGQRDIGTIEFKKKLIKLNIIKLGLIYFNKFIFIFSELILLLGMLIELLSIKKSPLFCFL